MFISDDNKTLVVTILVAFVLFAAEGTKAQQRSTHAIFYKSLQKQSNTYAPPVHRLGLQFGSGLLFGAAGGALGALPGLIGSNTEGPGGLAAAGFGALGFLVGYPVGTSLGIYIVANSHTYDASYGSILLGSFIGTGLGIGTIVAAGTTFGKGAPLVISSILALSTTIISGMVANKISIKPRNTDTSALLNISNNTAKLSFPSIQLTHFGGNEFLNKTHSNTYLPTAELLNISL